MHRPILFKAHLCISGIAASPHAFLFVTSAAVFLGLIRGADAAESFEKRLDDANALFQSGDYDGALSAYRDLQVEDPESGLLYYDMGCAQYEQAQSKAASDCADEAVEMYTAAVKSFEKANLNADAALRRDAQFNLANTAAQLAKLSVAPGKEDEAQKAFEECIQEYEEFLKRYPNDQAARNNLDHMRYYLKKMLQNPPPPQEDQQEEGEGEQQEQQDQQKKEQQEGENQQQQDQSQQQENQDDQERQEEQQTQQSEDKPDEEQQQEQQQASGEQQQEQRQAEEGEEESKPRDKQTIEALLQSLEDLDQREQYDVRQGDIDNRLRKEWW